MPAAFAAGATTLWTFGDSVLDCAHYNDAGLDPGRLLVRNDDGRFPEFRRHDLGSCGPARLAHHAVDGATVDGLAAQLPARVEATLRAFVAGLAVRPLCIATVYDPTFGDDARNFPGVDARVARANHGRVNDVIRGLAVDTEHLVDLHAHFLRGDRRGSRARSSPACAARRKCGACSPPRSASAAGRPRHPGLGDAHAARRRAGAGVGDRFGRRPCRAAGDRGRRLAERGRTPAGRGHCQRARHRPALERIERRRPGPRPRRLLPRRLTGMRVHHLNCISSCPLGGRLMDGVTPSVLERGRICCHCLLVESNAGLVLVDTGFGLNDVRDPKSRLSTFFLALLSPDFREEMTAIRQVEALGFKASDVRHILLTHLDFDHAGGLDDFPQAQVHLLAVERDHASLQRTWMDRQRFRPQQWSTRANWRAHGGATGERWYGFDGVRGGHGIPDDFLLVPLPGHTFGHAGIAIRSEGRWLLQAGDAYFHHREMDLQRPGCTPGLQLYQTMLEKDRRARFDNQARLRGLRRDHSREVEVFCAHDPLEFERLAGHAPGMPAAGGTPIAAQRSTAPVGAREGSRP